MFTSVMISLIEFDKHFIHLQFFFIHPTFQKCKLTHLTSHNSSLYYIDIKRKPLPEHVYIHIYKKKELPQKSRVWTALSHFNHPFPLSCMHGSNRIFKRLSHPLTCIKTNFYQHDIPGWGSHTRNNSNKTVCQLDSSNPYSPPFSFSSWIYEKAGNLHIPLVLWSIPFPPPDFFPRISDELIKHNKFAV